MYRSFKWITLFLLVILTSVSNGAGSSTRDYTWLLFLKVNEPPIIDAGIDQEITWAADSIFLDATVTDDPRDTLTYTWTKLDDPDYDGFGSPNAEDTTATLSAPGTYIFQLSVSDGKLTSISTVAITLNNSAPTVNAGVDQNFNYPTLNTSLSATASDDPMDTLSYSWSKVGGPGVVTFGSSSSEDTQAAFSKSGIYTLKLSVSDGDLTSSDEVKVTINNSAPIVNIFRDSILTESSSVDLAPDVTDATSGVLTYQWSKESGPGTVIFSNPNSVSTTSTLGQTGTYLLKFEASDGELSGSDAVTVDYLPQPATKIDVIVAFGDSITVGFGDSDCIEGFAKACSGYTVRLAPMLAGAKNYANSVTIWEEGKGGETSLGGLSRIQGIINSRPGADQYLVQYGTNDAISDPPPSKAVFKSRMSSIAQKINSAAGNPQPVLARVPWAKGTRSYLNTAIQLYNAAVGELYNELSYIKIPPPDFYSHFQSHPEQIWSYFMFDIHLPVSQRRVDDIHPRDTGYDAMASIWHSRLIQ